MSLQTPTAYYKLEGNLLDATGRGNNGIDNSVSGHQVSYGTGLVGQGASYDGLAGFKVLASADVNPQANSQFSVAFWFKPAKIGNLGIDNLLVSTLLGISAYAIKLDKLGNLKVQVTDHIGHATTMLLPGVMLNSWNLAVMTEDTVNNVTAASLNGSIFQTIPVAQSTAADVGIPSGFSSGFLGLMDEVMFNSAYLMTQQDVANILLNPGWYYTGIFQPSGGSGGSFLDDAKMYDMIHRRRPAPEPEHFAVVDHDGLVRGKGTRKQMEERAYENGWMLAELPNARLGEILEASEEVKLAMRPLAQSALGGRQ